jgi:hypothetical protein
MVVEATVNAPRTAKYRVNCPIPIPRSLVTG